MDTHQVTEEPPVTVQLDTTSAPYVRRWNQLISTTNWEKGRIITEWREQRIAEGATTSDYSDDAWSLLVGGVTGQHVGRLRRVHQRFGQVFARYEGLYWSHFQAALDWHDAEMWLEGAVRNGWSVSQMRRTRWETLGAVAADRPHDGEIVAAELDEDFQPSSDTPLAEQAIRGEYAQVQGPPIPEGPDFGDEEFAAQVPADRGASIHTDEDSRGTIQFVRPFENLAELPDDLAEAFESFKLAILRHKTEGWELISRDDVLACLDALKELVLAPSSPTAPF